MTREQVVEAALALADRDGLERLSIQSLASSLECGVMTIYGYIQSKGDLLDAIAQRGLRDLNLPRPLPDEVAAILLAWGRSLRQVLLDHPSLPMIFLAQPVVGPGIFRGVEALLGRLGRAGMAPSTGVHAVYAVLIYTTGYVAWELPRTHRQPPSAYEASWRREFANLQPAEFPLAGGVLDELALVAGNDQFEEGLAALAGGLAAHHVPHGSKKPTARRK